MPSNSSLIQVLSTAVIPLASFTSLSIYLAIHPASPLKRLFHQPISLSQHRDEELDGVNEKDPFDLDDPSAHDDGAPVEPEKFWASMWKRKLALLVLMLLPFACNVVLLVDAILSDQPTEEKTRAILTPALLVPSHLVTFLVGFWHLSQNETEAHWSTTIHQSSTLFTQFLVVSILALLPSEPLPSGPVSLGLDIHLNQHDLILYLLPILQLPPLILVLLFRRGPPLYMDMEQIYPTKITTAIPPDSDARDPKKSNVTEEAQATVPEWLLFSYGTNVIRKGYVAETMDVWDLPVLQARMRALPQYEKMRRIYGRNKGRLGRMEGFNLLLKVAKANKSAIIARESNSHE